MKVASSQTQLTIATSNRGAIALPDGKLAVKLAPAQPYLVSASEEGLVIGNRVFPNGILLLPDANGLVGVDGHWYRGQIRLIWAEGQINAINEIDLEHSLSVWGGRSRDAFKLATRGSQSSGDRFALPARLMMLPTFRTSNCHIKY